MKSKGLLLPGPDSEKGHMHIRLKPFSEVMIQFSPRDKVNIYVSDELELDRVIRILKLNSVDGKGKPAKWEFISWPSPLHFGRQFGDPYLDEAYRRLAVEVAAEYCGRNAIRHLIDNVWQWVEGYDYHSPSLNPYRAAVRLVREYLKVYWRRLVIGQPDVVLEK